MAINKLAKFQPERLSQIRKLRGLSMPDLALKTGLSRQAISLFEKVDEVTKPSAETLITLATSLNVNINFFTIPLRKSEKESVANSVYNFRSLKSSLRFDREQAKACLHVLAGTNDFFEDYLEIKPSNLPTFELPHFSDLTDEKIESLAEQTRRYWGLGDGAISDLTKLLENNGVLVAYLDFANGIDGVSAWILHKPVIVLSNRASAVRSRISLAHELGHLILHRTLVNEELEDKESLNIIEHQAWHFASCFMMPEKSFAKEVYSTNIDNLTLIKQKWGVSIKAVVMRIRKLGIISEHQASRVFQKMASLGYSKKEPLDDVLTHEQPSFFKRASNFLDENNALEISEQFFSLGYPDDFLIPIGIENRQKVIPDNVIQLKRPK